MKIKVQLTRLTNHVITQSISPPGPVEIDYIVDRVGETVRNYLRFEIKQAVYGQIIDLEININTLESQDINPIEGEGF